MTRYLPGAAAFTAAILVALLGLYANAEAPPADEAAEPGGRVKIRVLGVNDFHGHLEAPREGVGGAAWLMAHLEEATVPGRTIRVHAGDMIGATPLISSWFHDEPTMLAGNLLGFDVGTVGNHEFDEGGDELVVEALSYGIAYDLVDLTIERRTGEVVAKTGRIPSTRHDRAGDGRMAALVDRYRRRIALLATEVLGSTDTPLTRSGGELGRLAAEAERAFAGTDAAVVSPVALRADIAPGPITYGDVALALAYDHPVVRATLTGRELEELATRAGFFAGPERLAAGRTYTVAASEMLLPHGRAAGTEVEALRWYLERRLRSTHS